MHKTAQRRIQTPAAASHWRKYFSLQVTNESSKKGNEKKRGTGGSKGKNLFNTQNCIRYKANPAPGGYIAFTRDSQLLTNVVFSADYFSRDEGGGGGGGSDRVGRLCVEAPRFIHSISMPDFLISRSEQLVSLFGSPFAECLDCEVCFCQVRIKS